MKTAIYKCLGQWEDTFREDCNLQCPHLELGLEMTHGEAAHCIIIIEESDHDDCFGRYGPNCDYKNCHYPDDCREVTYAERWRRKTAFIPPFAGIVIITEETQ